MNVSDIVIQGNRFKISGNNTIRIFGGSRGKLTIDDLTLADSKSSLAGAVFNGRGTFAASNCTMSNNDADTGGAICNFEGAINLVSCTLRWQ